MRWLSDEALARLRDAADRPDLSGTRYEIVQEVGRGGMGTVYLARDAVLERTVALKVLTLGEAEAPEAERLLREAKIMARLEHPGLVPIHDAGTLADGRVFYAMKFVRGQRLDRYAAERHALSERLGIFRKICDAVAFAHSHGILHRDLKPENVMIGAFGEVLVLDWGVARRPDEPAEPEGTVLGTRAYMSPEQAEGRTGRVDARSDVYGLGAILAELAFAEPKPSGAARRALASVAARATAPDPDARYAAVDELSADVGRFLEGESPSAHREGLFERAGRVFMRYRAPILLVLAYLLMRILLIVFFPR